jgi:hypothetical protein
MKAGDCRRLEVFRRLSGLDLLKVLVTSSWMEGQGPVLRGYEDIGPPKELRDCSLDGEQAMVVDWKCFFSRLGLDLLKRSQELVGRRADDGRRP